MSGELSFKPFHLWFSEHHPTKKKYDFQRETGFSSKTVAKVWGDRFPVNSKLITTICGVYNLRIDQVVYYKEEPVTSNR